MEQGWEGIKYIDKTDMPQFIRMIPIFNHGREKRKKREKLFKGGLDYIWEGSGHCEKIKWMENWVEEICGDM